MKLYRERRDFAPRLSVLTVPILRRIHETFTVDELRDVEVLPQTRDVIHRKVKAGRTLSFPLEKLGGMERPDLKPQGTIDCSTGFKVNMVDRSIQLMSPCDATERWPLGSRIYGEDRFDDAESYRAALLRLIDQHMVEHVPGDMLVAFRDDLQYTPHPEGFSLTTACTQVHHVTGKTLYRRIGDLIERGDQTYSNIVDALDRSGANVFAVLGAIRSLFDRGLLDETLMSFDRTSGSLLVTRSR